MGKKKTYIIPFAGLKVGKHTYEFNVNDSFFESFEYSEVKKAEIQVDVVVNKQSTMLILDFKLEGTVNIMCDRCTDFFNLPIEGEQQLIVKFGMEDFEENDEIISLPASESELDIAQYIYEYIILLIPYKRTHKKVADCNKEIVKKLKKLAVKEEEKEIIDSRWEKLKGIKV